MRSRLLALAILILLATVATRADVFRVNATLDGYTDSSLPVYGTLSGTETIDTIRGVLTAFDITATLDGQVYLLAPPYELGKPPACASSCPPNSDPNNYLVFRQDIYDRPVTGRLDLDISATKGLIGYKGGGFCGGGADCFLNSCCDDDDVIANAVALYYVASGGLTLETTTPVATTSEPSSLLLLSTGFLGAIGAFRRQRQSRTHHHLSQDS